MRRLEVRLLPRTQLAGYLVNGFDGADNGDTVTGEGWLARFIPGEPIPMKTGGAIPVLFVEFDGERESEAAAFLAKMTMRGGG